MGYNDRGPNDWITNNEIQDAINNGLLSLKSGQSVVNNNTWITTDEANQKLNISAITGTGSNWITKNQIVATAQYITINASVKIDTSVNSALTVPVNNQFIIVFNSNGSSFNSLAINPAITNNGVARSLPVATTVPTSQALNVTRVQLSFNNSSGSGITLRMTLSRNGTVISNQQFIALANSSTTYAAFFTPNGQWNNNDNIDLVITNW